MNTSTNTSDRPAHVATISAAAQARRLLGQTARYQALPDGQHQVSIFDQAGRRQIVGIGATVVEAVAHVERQLAEVTPC